MTPPADTLGTQVSHRRLWLAAALHVALSVVTAAVVVAIAAYTALPAFGYHARVVGGGSMEPTIPLGSLIISRQTPASDLQVGDVITFRYPSAQTAVTHRVLAIRETEGRLWFTTKGDANPAPDPKEIELGTGADRVETSVPYAGYLVQYAGSTSGLLLMIVAPALMLLLIPAVKRETRRGAAKPSG